MGKSAAEIRREKLRQRQGQAVKTRDQKGLGRKSVLDWSKFQSAKPSAYQEKSGKDLNVIDFLPFVVTQEWYKDLHTFSGLTTNLDVGDWDYKLELPIHSGIGENNDVFLCNRLAFGGKCPACEEMFAEYEKDESDQDEKRIKALSPSWRCWYNVYDYSEESNPDGVNMIWENVSYHNFEKEILKEADEGDETVLYSDIEMGKTVKIKGKEKQLGKNKFIEAGNVEFVDREPYDESIVSETVSFDSLVRLCNYDDFFAVMHGDNAETTQTDNGVEQESSVTRGRRRGPAEKKEEKEPEFDPDEVPWKEGDECPKGLEFGNPQEDADECKVCPDEIFNACAEESDKRQAAGGGRREAAKKEAESAKSATSRRRSRR